MTSFFKVKKPNSKVDHVPYPYHKVLRKLKKALFNKIKAPKTIMLDQKNSAFGALLENVKFEPKSK